MYCPRHRTTNYRLLTTDLFCHPEAQRGINCYFNAPPLQFRAQREILYFPFPLPQALSFRRRRKLLTGATGRSTTKEGPCISQVRIPKIRHERHAVKREAAVYFDSTSLEGALSEASDYRPAFAGRQATDSRPAFAGRQATDSRLTSPPKLPLSDQKAYSSYQNKCNENEATSLVEQAHVHFLRSLKATT